MVYRKNITSIEQVLSVIAGVAMIIYGFYALSRYAWGHPWGYVIAVSGMITVLRGLFGFCPGCWMFGRKFVS